MKVKMKQQLTGTRDGARWPALGEIVDLPDREGAKLCASGVAEPVVDVEPEKAVPLAAEKRRGRGADPR